jgi:pyruvate formate lyase activating enzyme
MTHDQRCICCGKCAEACSAGAIVFSKKKERKIDRAKCNLCFECVSACPSGALTKVGKWMTIDEIMSEIEKDELLYFRSGGGVTVSGGEPLFQDNFVHKLLEACKRRGYHTAMDTCGYASWKAIERVIKYVDLFLYDIKHMDPNLHKKATGKSNKLILRNLRNICEYTKIWLRVPLIPRYNDSEENITKVGELGREIKAERISLMPFNSFGVGKGRNIGKPLYLGETEALSKERVEYFQRYLESFGMKVTVGE